MISFKEYYLLEITTPHHRKDSRITRGNKFTRNGNNIESGNLIANRYKKGDPNHKEPLSVGPISSNNPELLKYDINLNDIKNGEYKRLGNSKQAVKRLGNTLTIINI